MKQILINSEGLQTRAAVIEDRKLREYFIERNDEDHLVGSIFKARIKNLEPSLQAAFVDIGTDKNAFLHYWDMLPATKEVLEDEDDAEASSDAGENVPEPSAVKSGLIESLRNRFRRRTLSSPPQRQLPRRNGGKSQNQTRFTIEDIPELFPVNSEVLVQVTKGPIGTKGARVTTNLSIPGRYLVLLPNSSHVGVSKRVEDRAERDRLRQMIRRFELPPGMGLICRTVGAGRKECFFERDLTILLDCWRNIEEKVKTQRAPCCVYEEPHLVDRALRDFLTEDIDEVVTDSKEVCATAQAMCRNLSRQERVKIRHYRDATPLFEKYRLDEQIDNIFRRRVPLPSGGYICIDETEALIAIDVNSGKSTKGKDHPETIVHTNLEAVEEVARQLRLRNIGGLIVVDFIDMRARKDRQTVYHALKEALLADRAKTKTYPISRLGLVEMTRQREHESLRDALHESCPYCRGRGVVKSATSISIEIQRRLQHLLHRGRGKRQVRVTVHPHVLARLKNQDAGLLDTLEKVFGGELAFRPDPSMHVEEFTVVDMNTGEEV